MDQKQRLKLRHFITELSNIRGRHTELVSVYIPAGYDLNKIISHLAEEQGTASNIKDKNTRQNVQDSLERVIRHLRLYKKTPEHGLAVFAGNIAAQEGKTDIQVWSIEPPEPLQTRLYRCDQYFLLDLLKEMLEHNETYGLIVLDRREATLGLLRGTLITELTKLTSGVMGKFRTGGQSSARFARIREGMAKEFYKRVAEHTQKEFLQIKELKGIIIGGPGPTKYEFFEGNYLNNELKKKVLGVKDIGYTDEFGLHELVDKSQDILAKEAITKEKDLLMKFFTMLSKDDNKAIYGLGKVEYALDISATEIILISESIDNNILLRLEEKCSKSNTTLEIISTSTREGIQLRDLGGVAAILRYAIG